MPQRETVSTSQRRLPSDLHHRLRYIFSELESFYLSIQLRRNITKKILLETVVPLCHGLLDTQCTRGSISGSFRLVMLAFVSKVFLEWTDIGQGQQKQS